VLCHTCDEVFGAVFKEWHEVHVLVEGGTGTTVEEIRLETSIINKVYIVGVVQEIIIAKCGC
jgi:hypothetical protein